VQRRRTLIEGMSKDGKGKRRKSKASSSTTEGITKEGASTLYKEKCAGR